MVGTKRVGLWGAVAIGIGGMVGGGIFAAPTGWEAQRWLLHLLICSAIVFPTGLNLLGAASVARAETAIVGLKLAMLVFVGGIGTTTVEPARLL